MAINKKKYVELDSVRASYDPRTNAIQITAKDSDFQAGDSFKITLNNGTDTERVLRKVLQKHDLITERESFSLPRNAIAKDRDTRDDVWSKIPLGIDQYGTELVWDVNKDPHMFMIGKIGQGKPLLTQHIVEYLANYSDDWIMYDAMTSAYEIFDGLKNGMFDIFEDFGKNKKDTFEIIMTVLGTLKNRQRQVKEEQVMNYRELSNKPPAILLYIDHIEDLLGEHRKRNPSQLEYHQHAYYRLAIRDALEDIARLGRIYGIHLLLTSVQPITAAHSTVLRHDIGMKVSYSAISEKESLQVFGHKQGSLVSLDRMGRAFYENNEDNGFFQAYRP